LLFAVAEISIRGQEAASRSGLGAGAPDRVPSGPLPATHISGVVSDPAGAPAAGVIVTYHPGHYPGANPYCETKSDGNGHYDLALPGGISLGWRGSIHPTNFIVARWLDKNLAAMEPFVTVPNHLDLILKPGFTLSGSIKDATGAPVTNATVELSFMLGRDFLHPVQGRAGEDYSPAVIVKTPGSRSVDAHSAENPQPMKVDERGLFSFLALPQEFEYHTIVKATGYDTKRGSPVRGIAQSGRYEIPPFVMTRAK